MPIAIFNKEFIISASISSPKICLVLNVRSVVACVRVSPVTESDTGGSGGTIWEWNGEAGEKDDPAAATEARTTPLVTFTGRFSVRLSDIGKALKSKSSKSVTVYALAKVDQNWRKPTRDTWPKGQAPISHVVNARTQEGYAARNGAHVIRGQVWWASTPRCVYLSSKNLKNGSGQNDGVTTISRDGEKSFHSVQAPLLRGASQH